MMFPNSLCWSLGSVRKRLFCLAAAVGILLVAAASFLPGAACADEPEYDWAVGPYVGIYKFGGGEGDWADMGPQGGFEYQYRYTELIGIALRGGYGENGSWGRPSFRTLVFTGDVSAHFNFMTDERISPYAMIGLGAVKWRSEEPRRDVYDPWNGVWVNDTDPFIRLGLGAEYDLSEKVSVDLRIMGSYVIRGNEDMWLGGFWDPNEYMAEATVGLLYRFNAVHPIPDTDRDGVKDHLDLCPDTPPCTRVDEDGCPRGTPCRDSDEDGVCDKNDECPDTPVGAVVDARGCPQDSDRDGVFDGLDRCPGTQARVEVDRRGCPVDSDGDGVFNGIDRCPDTPRGTRVDNMGCPIPVPAPERIELSGVNFQTGTANLLPVAQTVLDEAIQGLLEHPDIRVEIRGYTDSVGAAEFNRNLSQQRADAVRNYMISRGVPPNQLTAIGLGEADPIASNDTAGGRAQNRRVEMRILN